MIPKRIHQIWLGPKELPAKFAAWSRSWEEKHPEWTYRLWREQDLPPLINQAAFERIERIVPAPRRYGLQADLIRFELLATFGGLYVDVDNECLRPVDDLLEGQSFVVATEPEFTDRMPTDFIASRPGHPLLWDLVRSLPACADTIEAQYVRGGLDAVDMLVAGPRLLARLLHERFYPDVTVLPFALIHPCRRWLREGANDYLGVAYVRNHLEPGLGMWAGPEPQDGADVRPKVATAARVPMAPNHHPRRAEGIEVIEAADSYVLYNRARDRIHRLNQTAVIVFELCTGEVAAGDLPALLQAAYSLPQPPEKEVARCLEMLLAEALIR